MEKKLNSSIEEILAADNVQGVVVSDKQGLCIAAGGIANESSSGLWTALLSEASKLEPGQPSPTLVFEHNKKQCIVQGNDKLVISIYKER